MPIRPRDPIARAAHAKLLEQRAASANASPAIASPPAPVPPSASTGASAAADMTAASQKRAHHIVDRSTANWDENGEYIVGKGRPPRAHQWRKGQSGNPRGPKPREKLTPIQAFEKEVLAEFTAKVNGEEVTINLGTFALQLMKASAAKGTLRSQKELLDLFLSVVRKQVDQDETPEMQAWEQDLIDQVIADYGLPPKPVFRDRDPSTPPAGEPR